MALKYWIGLWKGLKLSSVLEMKSKDMFDFSFAAGANKVYFGYDVIDRSLL